MASTPHLSEVFRIVEGALRRDEDKVRNYALLLADKLEKDGEKSSAARLRKIIEGHGHPLRPAHITYNGTLPIDVESRFPLLQPEPVTNDGISYVFSDKQRDFVSDYLSIVRSRSMLEARGLDADTNLLLFGPPGCGKTHLARFIAHELNLPLFIARLDGLISSFLGNTAKNVRAILEYASRTPCVLLLDEFDAIAKLRDDQQELGELKRVVNSVIQNLDVLSKDVVLIAATNHEQLLDPAVWRRFRHQLHVGLPDFNQREGLWKSLEGDIEWSSRELKALADLSEGFSGAEIEMVSVRLRERLVIRNERSSLRDALLGLLAIRQGRDPQAEYLRPEVLENPSALSDILQERNPGIYTLSLIGEIAGKSRVTMSRLESLKRQKAKSKR